MNVDANPGTAGYPGPRSDAPQASSDDGAERRFVSLPGGRSVAYFEAGTGPDLVLIHGALVNADDMRLGPMAELARRFHVVAFDRPGHGLSRRGRMSDASLWRQAEILSEAAAALDLVNPLLVGHSLGGAVALAWAMSRPDEIAGVVAIAPICFPEPRLEHLIFGPRAAPLAGDLLARTLHVATDPLVLPALWRATFLPQRMPETFANGFSFDLAGGTCQTVREGEDAALLAADLTRSALSYGGCRVPVRFLCGDADLVVNNHLHGRLAARLIPGAGFRLLRGMGHMLHHFRQDVVVAAAAELATAARPA